MKERNDIPNASKRVESLRTNTGDPSGETVRESCWVAVEAPVTLDVLDVGSYVFHCTPRDLKALAAGFLHTSGLIQRLEDIANIEERSSGDSFAVDVRLSQSVLNRIKDRSGADPQYPPVGDSFRTSASCLQKSARTLQQMQHFFPQTGGTHAAGLFRPDGSFAAFAEDVTRHSALDKAVGRLLMEGGSAAGLAVMLSGRVSVEMASKCILAGIELVAAVSAPTSLALEKAQRFNVTVGAFVREDRATVFTHPHRIVNVKEKQTSA